MKCAEWMRSVNSALGLSHDHLASLAIRFSPAQLRTLDEASIADPFYDRMWPLLRRAAFGSNEVQGWR